MTKRNIKPALEPLEASSAAHADQVQPPGSVDASITEAPQPSGFVVPPSPTSAKKRRASGPPPTNAGTTNAAGPQAQPEGLSLSPPPVKKSRTNTPWSPAEEQRLKTMRDAGSSWSEIAKVRSIALGSVVAYVRALTARQLDVSNENGRECKEALVQALLAAIKEYEASKWKVIGQKVGKPAKVG
ncbi:hypothetical protein FGG08_004449 [Glutinoglossum americanum]|uniref:Myb-like domain-containing protein n=1 Tax=Glutinoglossum americanum TaxID=1670608 RepID=A0A9P8I2D3_9PEZI|nr:hypothetical protein FGG08_004449 [Glutinoglossum americanum]